MFEAFIIMILAVISLVLLVPTLVFFIQCLMSLKKPELSVDVSTATSILYAVLVPAHNEEAGIGKTLASIKASMSKNARLLVVADNCTDATAKLAQSSGAEVIERFDNTMRGKGYALDFGISHLKSMPPQVLVIVDADCQVVPGSFEKLVECCVNSGRPVQSQYLMHAPEGSGLKMRIAEFAWLVKNRIRPLGGSRLGMPCQLMGSGMALPWLLMEKVQLASSHLVEDMKMGIDLALVGYPPIFCHDSMVYSYFPNIEAASVSQRTRWEHGHLSTIIENAPTLIGKGIVKRKSGLIGLGLDLLVPPLALLVMLQIVITVIDFAWLLLTGSGTPLKLGMVGTALIFFAVLLAWYRWARHILSFADLLSIPGYILSKVPIYLKFWTKKQVKWIRTDRD